MDDSNEFKFDWSIPVRPMINQGRSSITNSDLEISFGNSKQARAFVGLLIDSSMSRDINRDPFFNFEVEWIMGATDGENKHVVTIYDICWAKNLTMIAKMLEQVEYDMDG